MPLKGYVSFFARSLKQDLIIGAVIHMEHEQIRLAQRSRLTVPLRRARFQAFGAHHMSLAMSRIISSGVKP
jgi:hypothetical protein